MHFRSTNPCVICRHVKRQTGSKPLCSSAWCNPNAEVSSESVLIDETCCRKRWDAFYSNFFFVWNTIRFGTTLSRARSRCITSFCFTLCWGGGNLQCVSNFTMTIVYKESTCGPNNADFLQWRILQWWVFTMTNFAMMMFYKKNDDFKSSCFNYNFTMACSPNNHDVLLWQILQGRVVLLWKRVGFLWNRVVLLGYLNSFSLE